MARPPGHATLLFIFALFLWVGGSAPTPMFLQYYYESLPFVVLLAACLLARAYQGRRLPWGAVAAVVTVTAVLGASSYRSILRHLAPSKWGALEAHRLGLRAAADAGRGPVLTLQPAIALEGRMDVYPSYVVGVFMLRTDPLMTDQERHDLASIDPSGLPADLDRRPPDALLSSPDTLKLESPLLAYARRRGWEPKPLGAWGDELWLAPKHSP
jgi:hypothetical protein